MANLDKTSVRAEVSRLKNGFKQLCASGKITAESKVLMMSMFMIVGLILSIFRKRLPRPHAQELANSLFSDRTQKINYYDGKVRYHR